MSNGHDSDVIVCHLVIDRKWKALHQNTTIGSEIRYAHPGIQTQEIQYCAKLVVKLGTQTWELSVVIIRDFFRLPVSRRMKRDCSFHENNSLIVKALENAYALF